MKAHSIYGDAILALILLQASTGRAQEIVPGAPLPHSPILIFLCTGYQVPSLLVCEEKLCLAHRRGFTQHGSSWWKHDLSSPGHG